METLLRTPLPSVEDLEERLRNGVVLVQLGKVLLPNDPIWSRAYDLDESRYTVNMPVHCRSSCMA